jgi:hypothetical protein
LLRKALSILLRTDSERRLSQPSFTLLARVGAVAAMGTAMNMTMTAVARAALALRLWIRFVNRRCRRDPRMASASAHASAGTNGSVIRQHR